jgi:hypothetical protein
MLTGVVLVVEGAWIAVLKNGEISAAERNSSTLIGLVIRVEDDTS